MGCVIAKPEMSDEMYCNQIWKTKNYDQINSVFTERLSNNEIVINSRLLATIITAIINGNYKAKSAELISYRNNFPRIKSAFLFAINDTNGSWEKCFDKLIAFAVVAKNHQRKITFTDF